jgi:hypothetical protein
MFTDPPFLQQLAQPSAGAADTRAHSGVLQTREVRDLRHGKFPEQQQPQHLAVRPRKLHYRLAYFPDAESLQELLLGRGIRSAAVIVNVHFLAAISAAQHSQGHVSNYNDKVILQFVTRNRPYFPEIPHHTHKAVLYCVLGVGGIMQDIEGNTVQHLLELFKQSADKFCVVLHMLRPLLSKSHGLL